MKSMKYLSVLLTLVISAMVFSTTENANAAARNSHLNPPPGSYLSYEVFNVQQLIQELQDNPTVRARYARHFHIPQDRVVSYMRDNLVQSWVPKTRVYTVYCVSRSGRLYPIHQTFRKGTKVFALRNGEPVLKWICGNPLMSALPAVQQRKVVRRLPPPVQKVSPSLQELTPAEDVNVLVPNETAAPELQPLIPFTAGAPSVPLTSGGGGSISPLPFLLPAAFLFGHNGSSSPHGIIPPPIAATPEPEPIVYVALALPLILLGVSRRQRMGTSAK